MESYIQEQYSPKAGRKQSLLVKSISIDATTSPATPRPNYLQSPLKTLNQTKNLLTRLVNNPGNARARAKSPSPQPGDLNSRKVQFLDVPQNRAFDNPDIPLKRQRSRSPIKAVTNFFKKSPTETKERRKSLTKIVKDLGNKITNGNNYLKVDYTSASEDNSSGDLPNKENTFRERFRKFSHGAFTLGRSEEKLVDPLSDFERTKQNLLRSKDALNRSPRAKDNTTSSKREKPKELPDNLVTRNITECFRDSGNRKLKYSPPPESKSLSVASVAPSSSSSDSNRSVRRDNGMFGSGLKLKERLVVGASVAALLFTLLLLIDLQVDLGMTGNNVIPSHGRVKYVSQDDGPGSAYNSFRKRFLQKTHR